MSNGNTRLPLYSPVLIVGAGPTGLTLAVELSRRNIDFLLVDRRPEPLPFDRATVIHSRSLEIFESMGVIDAFLERGHLMRGFNIFAYGQIVAQTDFNGLECRHPYDLNLSENETEEILTARLVALGGAVTRGWELSSLEQSESQVIAQLRSTDGTEQSVAADWLVGTDGIHSRVREACGIDVDGHRYLRRWGVIDGQIQDWQHAPDRAAIQIEAPSLNPIPLPRGRWRIYFRDDDDIDNAALLEQINAGLEILSPGSQLHEPDEPMLYHTYRQLSAHYQSGRVLLAGDAAHACSPIEGHGMNMGIHDSFNLGWKLALVIEGTADAKLLASYEQERRPAAAAVGASGDTAEELRSIPDNPAAVERVKRALCAMLTTSRGQLQAAQAESELEFHYRDSPLVSGYHAAGDEAKQHWFGPLPGDCTPDAGPLMKSGTAEAIQLSQLICNEGHSLLWMATDQTEVPAFDEFHQILQACGVFWIISTACPPEFLPESSPQECWLHDIAGKVHARFGVIDPSLFLIRPDGHIALRCEPPELTRVTSYFETLLH
ncbi:FAD-dependent monooxygenase [Gimesia algae]|uniref:Pentachlorophenol 4-monooxygenase n=1 Tax=Gimesia algae TaxID=2527971 RepID=A0A517VGV0_9PLAN|nr:FAD-dependent monooxygenase [Gimesia algae]QDT92239.1 Pentachlorophenol 4-monooxygenase [Gimesia algae]